MIIMLFHYIATQCLRYNIFSAWFLDIRMSTCFCNYFSPWYIARYYMAIFHYHIAMYMTSYAKALCAKQLFKHGMTY